VLLIVINDNNIHYKTFISFKVKNIICYDIYVVVVFSLNVIFDLYLFVVNEIYLYIKLCIKVIKQIDSRNLVKRIKGILIEYIVTKAFFLLLSNLKVK
jgi:hypothetical protein